MKKHALAPFLQLSEDRMGTYTCMKGHALAHFGLLRFERQRAAVDFHFSLAVIATQTVQLTQSSSE